MGAGGMGISLMRSAEHGAARVHREDRMTLQENLASLGTQYMLFSAKELLDLASRVDWSLLPDDQGDRATLERLVDDSLFFDHGAALVSLRQEIITVFAPDGIPGADDPGYQPLVQGLLANEPGLSAVMDHDGAPLVAVGVPVLRDGQPVAVLLAYFNAARTPLQTYVTQLDFGQTGAAFVLDGNGVAVAAGDPALIGTRVPYADLLADLAPGETTLQEVTVDGIDSVLSSAGLEVGGWSVAARQSADEFYGPIHDSSTRARVVVLLALVLAAGFLLYLNHRRIQALREAARRVYYDQLTELPNRTYFLERLEASLARARRDRLGVGVLFVDLDHFKVINDSLGHRCGDALLEAVAVRLREATRAEDMVARLGGDEFTVLVDHLEDPSLATRVAQRLQAAFDQPFEVDGRRLDVTMSIGVAVCPDGASGAEDMLRDADLAMYRAKGQGRACTASFEPELADEAMRRLQLEGELRAAIENHEVEVHYQAQVALVDGALVGAEALARWRRPSGSGWVPTEEFIRLAESSGLILPLGRQILAVACAQARRWEDAHGMALPISVNVSPVQLRAGERFVEEVQAVLDETGLAPGLLTLEVTEQVIVDDEAAGTLVRLAAMGIHIAIDDFGSGHAALSHLYRFPVHELKLDRRLVNGIDQEPKAQLVVSSLVKLASKLGIVVTAEGVEARDRAVHLRSMGCHRAQGHLFHTPGAAETIEQILVVQSVPWFDRPSPAIVVGT